MAPPSSFCRMVVLISLLCASANAEMVNWAFLLDSNVRSIEASVIEYKTVTHTVGSETVASFIVNCPTARNPHNDACRSESIYPATFWHTYGSVFEGITTARRDDSTTYWACDLAGGLAGAPFCVNSITDKAGKTTVTTTKINECYIQAHSVAMVVTASAELIPKEHYETIGVTGIISVVDAALAEMGCSSTTAASTSTSVQSSSHTITSSATMPTATATATATATESSTSSTSSTSPATSTATSTPAGTTGSGAAGMSPGAPMVMIVGSLVFCLAVW